MRLIDADALIKKVKEEGAYDYVYSKKIAEAPTIDAVEVVRCRDCKNWEEYEGDEGYGHCELFIHYMKDDNFCGHGERKTEPQTK